MNSVHYGSLMKLAGDTQELFQLFLAQMIQHAGIHHVGGKVISILKQKSLIIAEPEFLWDVG